MDYPAKKKRRGTYVEILQNTAKDLRFFVRKINPLTLRTRTILTTTRRRKERARNQHILVRRKQAALLPHREGHDGGGEGSSRARARGAPTERLLQSRQLRRIPIRLRLLQLDSLLHAVRRAVERALEHGCGGIVIQFCGGD